jgi:hypothetical protein
MLLNPLQDAQKSAGSPGSLSNDRIDKGSVEIWNSLRGDALH